MVKNKTYIPDRGDVVWINFNPQVGCEQAGKRLAVILSPKEYNQKTNLALMCPITSQIKNYPFEIIIKEKNVKGVVISDQVRSLDWKIRRVSFIQKISLSIIKEIQENIKLLLMI